MISGNHLLDKATNWVSLACRTTTQRPGRKLRPFAKLPLMKDTAFTFRRAGHADLDALTDLVIRSKASNGYSEAFMQAFRPELVIGPDSLDTGEIWVSKAGRDLAGVMHVVVEDQVAEVEALFVEPRFKRTGLGRQLWGLLEDRMRVLGAVRVELDSDPFAVGFYEAMGCEVFGETPSDSIPGRMLPRLRKTVR